MLPVHFVKFLSCPWVLFPVAQILSCNFLARVESNRARYVIGNFVPPDYSEVFEIYTDASSKQLGAVITQNNRPIAFFSRKLSDAQSKYTITKLELLAIVETLKEFNGMLWGQRINVYTDHKNLTRDGLLGLTPDNK